MNARPSRPALTRGPVAPLHRGPQAHATLGAHHAPNAALLIDFDNVTMGIRSDLQTELRNLLGSDIIHGKVSVQRAYADWRRYPQYIVPLSESSIDLIFAPAYGSSKKNATDIRLAIDALELVFTRPEIGTFILLSGDSDFSSLVIKLKEYGKYVIGVGIRESSSDLLVQNCDEYYSYNALAGLVKSGEEERVKHDPWELVVEAIARMARNGDVMRSDRLKQVMQDIDSSFDEKDLGYSKFSKFCQDAAARGLLTVSRLENGQLEVAPAKAVAAPAATPAAAESEGESEERVRRSRRGRGRGRDRDREPREAPRPAAAEGAPSVPAVQSAPSAAVEPAVERAAVAPAAAPPRAPAPTVSEPAISGPVIGRAGERLTRSEAFDLVKRAVESLVSGDEVVRAGAVRVKAYELLGRDSESLSERNFPRILRDAHDGDVIDLRRRGDDYEVALAVSAAPIADQLNVAAAAIAAARTEDTTPAAPRGMGARGGRPGGRGGRGLRAGPAGRGATPPPDLFSVGVVEDVGTPTAAPVAPPAIVTPPPAAPAAVPAAPAAPAPSAQQAAPAAPPRKQGRAPAKGGARKAVAKTPAKSPAKSPAKEPAKQPARTAAKPEAKSPAKGGVAKTAARTPAKAAATAAPRVTPPAAPTAPAAAAAAAPAPRGGRPPRKAAAKKSS
ncbi:MAG TPA: NYN domain-containing protein [Gemmatimonadaceae bacterium]|nr:NYN domain-containing protein [Gemmatimonadaceae bacterium]